MRFSLVLAFIGALAAAIATPAVQAASVIHRGNGAEPDTLDPGKSQGHWEANIIGDMLMGLTTEGLDGKPIPGAAESWTVSEDGLTWTFHLRAGATWSDGVPVTADDFVLAWKRLLDPAFGAQYASILYVVKDAEAVNSSAAPVDDLGVRAVDAATLEVSLAHPAPYLDQLVAHQAAFPVPKHAIEAFGDQWVKAGNYVANGPYVLAEWRPQDYVKLVKNPAFYDSANVQIDEVYFYPTQDTEAALKRFRAGELDMQDTFPGQQLDWLKENMPESVQIFPFLAVQYIVFNTQRQPFGDKRVREALSLAADTEIITDKIYRFGEPVAESFVPPVTANYPATASIPFKGQNGATRLERAKALLAEAGFGSDNPLSFKFNYITDADNRRAAIALADMWKQAGCNVEIVASESKIHYVNVLQPGDYDVALAAWAADYDDAENFLFMLESNNKGFNYGRWFNPQYDALMARARNEKDLAARGKILTEAEQTMLDDFAVMPTRFPYTRYLVSPRVKGFQPNAREIFRTRWMSIDPSS